MGWRGTIRSINAAAKRAEREADRRYKAQLKQEIAESAAEAVAAWAAHIEKLQSLHHEVPDAVDWQQIAVAAPPVRPQPDVSHTKAAKRALDDYKPRFSDRLRFGGAENRRQKLLQELEEAKDVDRDNYRRRIQEYEKAKAEWQADTITAEQLFRGDPDTMVEVIKENQSLSDAGLIGRDIRFRIENETGVHAILAVHSSDVVPDFRRKQLASGKLSETKMPQAEFFEIYQDYVASAAFRVAGELFAILPIEEVFVTCTSELLNSATGHLEPTPILSVQFVRPTYDRLNVRHIDPSDALANFNHSMSFKRTNGFARIEPLSTL